VTPSIFLGRLQSRLVCSGLKSRLPSSVLLGQILLMCLHAGVSASAQQVTTVGLITRSADQVSSTINSLARASLADSQTVRGQQQLLLASIIRITSARLADGYSSRMNKPLSEFDRGQQEPLQNFTAFLISLSNASDASGSEYSAELAKALDVSHHVLDTVPTASKPPVLFGLAIPGVLSTAQPPDQLIILGYHLMESTSDARRPSVAMSDKNVPSKILSADFGRITAQIPPELIKDIGHEDSSCNPIRPVTVSVHAYYRDSVLAGYFSFSTDTILTTQLEVPRPEFEVSAEFIGTPVSPKELQVPFSASSQSINVGCEQTSTTSVQWNAPDGARITSSVAQWVDINNLAGVTQSTSPGAHGVTAFGSISGLSKQCALFGICNCPGGGHGRLLLQGTYAVLDTQPKSAVSHVLATTSTPVAVPIPFNQEWKITGIHIHLFRKGCKSEIDEIEIQQGYLAGYRELKSSKGLFVARMNGGNLSLQLSGAGL
jgi:hypothetical protein